MFGSKILQEIIWHFVVDCKILFHPIVSSSRFRSMESFEEAIQRAVLELQVNQNPKNATEQEEFIANLTRQVSMHGNTACFYSYDIVQWNG